MKSSINITKGRNTLAEAFAKSIANIESQVEIRILHIVEELLQFLKREGINRSELTQCMGVPPSRITKLLSGDSNLTIDHSSGLVTRLAQTSCKPLFPQGSKGHWGTSRSTPGEPMIRNASSASPELRYSTVSGGK